MNYDETTSHTITRTNSISIVSKCISLSFYGSGPCNWNFERGKNMKERPLLIWEARNSKKEFRSQEALGSLCMGVWHVKDEKLTNITYLFNTVEVWRLHSKTRRIDTRRKTAHMQWQSVALHKRCWNSYFSHDTTVTCIICITPVFSDIWLCLAFVKQPLVSSVDSCRGLQSRFLRIVFV
jgi:hypothetical protein